MESQEVTHPQERLTGDEVAGIAMNQHYAPWDTQGAEESNLYERIEPFGPYVLVQIPLTWLPKESPYEIDEDLVEELAQEDPSNWKPITAPFSEEAEVADGWHRVLAAHEKEITHILGYIPAKKAKKLPTQS